MRFFGGKRESLPKVVHSFPSMEALVLTVLSLSRLGVLAQNVDEEQISELHRREILGQDDGWMNWVGESYLPGVLLVIGVVLLIVFLIRGRPLL